VRPTTVNSGPASKTKTSPFKPVRLIWAVPLGLLISFVLMHFIRPANPPPPDVELGVTLFEGLILGFLLTFVPHLLEVRAANVGLTTSQRVQTLGLAAILLSIGAGLISYADYLNETTTAVGVGLDPRGVPGALGFLALAFGAFALVIAVFSKHRSVIIDGIGLQFTFGGWYARTFGRFGVITLPVQAVLWLLYGFIWIPLLYFVALKRTGTGRDFSVREWYGRTYGAKPLGVQVTLWFFWGYVWIPIAYAVALRRKVIEVGPA
jgi:hypothetical protein